MSAGPDRSTEPDRRAEPLVEVRDLEVHYPVRRGTFGRAAGAIRAVDGVSFDLRPGETLGLVGESGCGKSTTARALLRLVAPSAGTVVFDGSDVGSMDREALRAMRRRAQIVFQDPAGSLNPRMSVEAVLLEILTVHGLGGPSPASRRARAVDLLEKVGLGAEHMRRYPHELSGGQRQRVGIARALSVEPDLLILDEPVSSLDISVQAQVVNLLRDLQAQLGLTYLFIAHDLSLVRHVSDRVAVMYSGRIVEVGEVGGLFRAARHPYTAALLSAVPRPDPGRRVSRERIVLEGDPPRPADPPEGCPFHARCPSPLKDASCIGVYPTTKGTERGHEVACHHPLS